MSSAGAHTRPPPWPWRARPKTWFISSWIASRSWKGSQRDTLMMVLPPPGLRGSCPLLLVLVALVDDLGVDHVTVGLGCALVGGGGRPGLVLAGAGLGLGVDRPGELLLQAGQGRLDAGTVLVGDLVAVVLEALLGLVDELLGPVLGLGGLAAAAVLLGVLLGLVDHPVDVLLGQRGAAGDGHRLLLAGAAVLGRDVDDAVG